MTSGPTPGPRAAGPALPPPRPDAWPDATATELRWQTHGPSQVVSTAGEIDLATAPHLCELIRQATRRPGRRLIVDLSAVTFMDCSGVNAVMLGYRLTRPDGSVAVVCPERSICRRLLELTGVTAIVPIYPSLPAALSAGAPRPPA